MTTVDYSKFMSVASQNDKKSPSLKLLFTDWEFFVSYAWRSPNIGESSVGGIKSFFVGVIYWMLVFLKICMLKPNP